MPVIGGHLEGRYLGEPAEVDRFGLGDPRLRVAINLYGAPAMTPKEFASYRRRIIVGVSLTVAPPLGQYDPTKLINLGTNRWSLKPEVGFRATTATGSSRRWPASGSSPTTPTSSAGARESRIRLSPTQVHVTYRFTRAMWLAADANYYTGGPTTIGGKQNLDLQRNSRIGATFSSALDRHQAIRMSVSRGAYTTIGADFTSIAVGYNYAWARQ